MDYISYCQKYFSVTHIPVNLIHNNESIYSAIGDYLSVKPTQYYEIAPVEHNPAFYRYSPDFEYGGVKIEGTDYMIFLGPIFSIPITKEIVRNYMLETAIPLEHQEVIAEFLSSIPRITHQQFLQHLILIHMSLNQKEIEIQDFYQQSSYRVKEHEAQILNDIVQNYENENFHNTYFFELKLYQHIKEGSVEKLNDFLLSSTDSLCEGKLANTPLRHAKNLFILSAAKVGFLGSIPGGLDIEKTYQLVDLYIQECEQLQTIESIKSLQNSMLQDFCRRTGETQIPSLISSDVYICMNYIRSHINESIDVKNVASQIHRSASYTMKHFKNELGINMGAYIIRCKLEEAKSLLTYSEKSLSEISNYLCFSSQSYFQNVFKKKYGVTPLQYRQKTQKT